MKAFTALCIVAVVLAVASAQKRKLKVPQTTPEEIRQILSTKEGATEFVNCVQKPNSCRDPRAHSLARLAPILMQTRGRCKDIEGIKCTSQDEENIRLVVSMLNRYNGLYSKFMRSLIRASG